MSEATFLNRKFLDDLTRDVADTAKDLLDYLTDSMIDSKGLAWGDVPLNAEERVTKFMNDEAGGVNEQLKMNNPEEYSKRLREFQRDVTQLGLGGA